MLLPHQNKRATYTRHILSCLHNLLVHHKVNTRVTSSCAGAPGPPPGRVDHFRDGPSGRCHQRTTGSTRRAHPGRVALSRSGVRSGDNMRDIVLFFG